MYSKQLSPRGESYRAGPLNTRRHGPDGSPRRQGALVPSQVASAIALATELGSRHPCAACVGGSGDGGKSTVIRSGIRHAGRRALFYRCPQSSSANHNVQRIHDMLERSLSGAEDPDALVLFVEHVERSTCKEALAQNIKRMVADAGVAVVFEVNDDVHGCDVQNAYCRRTRGILTHAPLTVGRMTNRDALTMVRHSWADRYPGRHMPEYLAETTRNVIDGKFGPFAAFWRFAVPLFDNETFVEPARLWEFRRPQEDDYLDAPTDSPVGPFPSYPDAELRMEVERLLAEVTGCMIP
jgi:hypothetical protein